MQVCTEELAGLVGVCLAHELYGYGHEYQVEALVYETFGNTCGIACGIKRGLGPRAQAARQNAQQRAQQVEVEHVFEVVNGCRGGRFRLLEYARHHEQDVHEHEEHRFAAQRRGKRFEKAVCIFLHCALRSEIGCKITIKQEVNACMACFFSLPPLVRRG